MFAPQQTPSHRLAFGGCGRRRRNAPVRRSCMKYMGFSLMANALRAEPGGPTTLCTSMRKVACVSLEHLHTRPASAPANTTDAASGQRDALRCHLHAKGVLHHTALRRVRHLQTQASAQSAISTAPHIGVTCVPSRRPRTGKHRAQHKLARRLQPLAVPRSGQWPEALPQPRVRTQHA